MRSHMALDLPTQMVASFIASLKFAGRFNHSPLSGKL